MEVSLLGNGNPLNEAVTTVGGTFTGPVYLYGDPTLALECATKQYVDSNLFNHASDMTIHLSSTQKSLLSGITVTSADINQMSGAVSSVQTQLNNRFNLTGGTMTGSLLLNADPTSSLHAATKEYVDNNLTSLNSLSVGDVIVKPVGGTLTGYLQCNGAYLLQSAYPGLYAVIGQQYYGAGSVSEVSIGYIYSGALGSGKPWRQQYDISPLGSSIGSFTIDNNVLPVNLYTSQAIVTKNFVYLLGGRTASGTSVNSIYRAPINSDGTIGAFVLQTNSLPGVTAIQQAIVTKNRVYVLGGALSGTGSTASIYTAVINSDGTLGTFSVASVSLPGGMMSSQAVITKNRFYLLGGYNGSAVVSSIYTAPINSDGTLGAFTTDTNTLPVTLADSQVVVTKNRVYLLGGTNGTTAINTIFSALLLSDGTIGSFTAEANILPTAFAYSQVVATYNKVHLIGGGVGGGVYSNKILTSNINADGTLGAFVTSTSTLPAAICWGQAFLTKNMVYYVGGTSDGTTAKNVIYKAAFTNAGLNDYTSIYDGTINKFDGTDLNGIYSVYKYVPDTTITLAYTSHDALGSGKPWKFQYDLSPSAGSVTSAAASGLTLPTAVGGARAVVTKNRVYLLGGHSSSGTNAYNTIQTAIINSDGTLGPFTIDANTLPLVSSWHQIAVTKNRVYLFGGSGNGGNPFYNIIYYATINADGTLSAFTNSGNVLPVTLAWAKCIVTKNTVYLIGGATNVSTYSNAIYKATINADGSLGAFVADTNTLPLQLANPVSVVTQNRVYLLGGSNVGTAINSIYTAIINADGTLGVFTLDTNTLPVALSFSRAVTLGNKVYIFGGYNGSASTNTIYVATINADGTLNAFTNSGITLPSLTGWEEAVITQNHIYLLGGYDAASSTAQNYVTAIQITNVGLNDYQQTFNGNINKFDGTDLSGTLTILSGTPDPSIYFAVPDTTYIDSLVSDTHSYIKT